MKKRQLHLKNSLALLAVASLFSLGQPARAQSAPAQDNKDTKTVQDNDTTRTELAQFDQFLDSHPEIAEQLRKDPSLVNNKDFVEKHSALQTYLQQHSAVREELKETPRAFTRDENRFDRTEDAQARDTRGDEARFDQFLDSHREIAEQLRKDPSLANNREFVEKHLALQTFLQEQPGIRDQLKDNPNAFVRRAELAERQDDHFDRRDDARDRDTHARFGEFLHGHDDVAKDLSRNPSLAKDHDYMEKHHELQAYLDKNTDVRDDLMKDPNNFVKSAQQFRHNNTGWTAPQTQTLDPSKTPDAKPKQ